MVQLLHSRGVVVIYVALFPVALAQNADVFSFFSKNNSEVCTDPTTATVPLGLSGECIVPVIGSNRSVLIDCDNTAISLFENSVCDVADLVSSVDMGCTNATVGQPAAASFGCTPLPADELIRMTFADSCDTDTAISGAPLFSLVYRVNNCIESPGIFSQAGDSTSSLATVSTQGVVTHLSFLGTRCSGTPFLNVTGVLGSCTTFTTPSLGRRLQGTAGVLFTAAVPGTTIKTETRSPTGFANTKSPTTGSSGSILHTNSILVASVLLSWTMALLNSF